MAYYFRRMRAEDVDQVTEIDRESFPNQWPPADYKHELHNRMARYIVVCDDEKTYDVTKLDTSTKSTGLTSRLRRWFSRSRSSVDDLLAPPAHYIIGFAGLWLMVDEAHITNIAVRLAYQRRGLGELLLISLINIAQELKASIVTLEVRVSNTTAQGLYLKHGFNQTGIRQGYYVDRGYQIDSREDGLVMSTEDITLDTFRTQLEKLKQAYLQKWGITSAQIERWLSIQ
ncbi:ribosomal protein S18-alanine N-acetyltransferase [Chloroflexota bacterium]